MFKVVLGVLIVCAALYLGYHFLWHARASDGQFGEIHCSGCAPEQVASETGDRKTAGTSSMVAPSSSGGQPTLFAQPSAGTAAASSLPVVPTASSSLLPAEVPAHDSEPANSPNGMRFAGTGTYQWYRQGDLTYRIDTATGKSCIIYATKKQWRDPLVYNNGCGRAT